MTKHKHIQRQDFITKEVTSNQLPIDLRIDGNLPRGIMFEKKGSKVIHFSLQDNDNRTWALDCTTVLNCWDSLGQELKGPFYTSTLLSIQNMIHLTNVDSDCTIHLLY